MDDQNKHKFKVLPPKNSNPPEDRIRFRKKHGKADDDELENPNSYHKPPSKPQKRHIKVKRSTKRKESANNQNEIRSNKISSNSDKQAKKFDYDKFNRKNRKNELRNFHTPEDVTKIVYDLITEINSLQEEISELSEKVSKKEKKFDDEQELLIEFKRRNNIQEDAISPRNQKRTLDSSYEQERVYTLTKYLSQLQCQMDQLDERYEKDKDYFTNNTLDHLKIDVCMLNHDINEVQTELDEDQSLLELGQNELQSESLAKGIRIYEKQQKKIGRMKSKLNSLLDEERGLIEQRNHIKVYGKTTTNNNKSEVDKLKHKYNTLLTIRKNKEQQLESKKQAEEAKQKKENSAKKPKQVVKKPNAKNENAEKTFDFISALDHDSQAEIPDNESNSSENQNNTKSSQDLNDGTKQSSTELNQSHSDNANKSDIDNDSNQSHNDNSNDNDNLNENDNSDNADNDDNNENHITNNDNDGKNDNSDNDNNDNNDDNLDGSGFDDKSKQSDSNENNFDSNSQLKSTGGSFNQSKHSDTNLDDDFEQSDKNEGSLMQMGKSVIDALVNANETNQNDASDDFNEDFDKMNKDYVQMQANIIDQLNTADAGNDGEDDMEFDSEADKTKQNSSLNKNAEIPNEGLSHTAKSKESTNQLCDDDDDDIISGSMASMNSTLSASIRIAKELTDNLPH